MATGLEDGSHGHECYFQALDIVPVRVLYGRNIFTVKLMLSSLYDYNALYAENHLEIDKE